MTHPPPSTSDNRSPALEVENLSKRYGGRSVVDGVSFSVRTGEIFGIIGANGSGKTTTVECVQGLRSRDSGVVRVFGIDPSTDPHAARRLIGSQLQQSELPDRLRVWEALDLFAAISPSRAPWEDLLTDWGLEEVRDTAFGHLSGGQRQRLLVALAIVARPRLVFLDEMTTALDPAARRTAWSLIEQLRDGGATVVLVTHFMDEAERLCDRIAVFDHGRIVDHGTPAELVARHGGDPIVRFSTSKSDLSWLADVSGVRQVHRDGAYVEVHGAGPLLARTAAALVAHNIAPEDLRTVHVSLEDALIAITNAGRP